MRGDLRIADAPVRARWDWGWLDGCFGESRISASDIDAIWERHGWFLVFEIKKPDETLYQGQLLLLRALSASTNTSVYVIRGLRNEPLTIAEVSPLGLGEEFQTSRAGIRALVSDWYAKANAA